MGSRPLELATSHEFGKGSKDVRTARPKRFVMVDYPNEGSDIGVILGPIHLQDDINSLLPRFDFFRCHPEPQEVCFLYKPFTF